MRHIKYTHHAIKDIDYIWEYTVETWSENQAWKYNEQIEQACLMIAEGVQFGLAANHIGTNYRTLLVNKHTIYFRCTDNTVEIIRVLHQKMDVARQID